MYWAGVMDGLWQDFAQKGLFFATSVSNSNFRQIVWTELGLGDTMTFFKHQIII